MRPERRRSVRICCSGFAEGVSDSPSHLFRGEMRNVSETGCFISVRASLNLPRDVSVQLRFRMGRSEYSAVARVIETIPGIGIRMQFIVTDPEFAGRMRRILSANAQRQS